MTDYEQVELQCHIDYPSAFVKILDVENLSLSLTIQASAW
jgi:hypothetical protein